MGKEMPRSGKKGGGKREKVSRQQHGSTMVTDPRFSAIQTDPRFHKFPRAKNKVEVDERFSGMFNDPAFEVRTSLDKRGRKLKSSKPNQDMRRYYRLKDEADWTEEPGENDATVDPPIDSDVEKRNAANERKKTNKNLKDTESLSSSDEDEDVEMDAAQQRWLRMRGLAGPESSGESDYSQSEEDEIDKDTLRDSDDSDSDSRGTQSDIDSEDDDDAIQEAIDKWGIGAMAANPSEEVPLLPDATSRIALVDLDWEHIRAIDIFAALRSFVPKDGRLNKVTVYPSDYGLERMAQEATKGPQNIWKNKNPKTKKGTNSSESDTSSKDSLTNSDDDSIEDGEVDQDQLRLYERSKLRWYYAIAEFDSAPTANSVYEECDGMEFLKSACKFDLRFVPDDTSFDGRKVRDAVEDVDPDYVPPTFQTKALQHTNVELTWDKGDENRKRALTRRLNDAELKEDDFKAYIASTEEDSDDSEQSYSQNDEEEENQEEETDSHVGKDPGNGKTRPKIKKDKAEALRERYRRLLLNETDGDMTTSIPLERKGKKDWANSTGTTSDSGSDDEEMRTKHSPDGVDMEMQVTFDGGLENLAERLAEKKRLDQGKKSETVWEAYMRRKREKKAELRKLGKVNVDSDTDESSGDSDVEAAVASKQDDDKSTGFDDPFFHNEPDGDPFNDPFFDETLFQKEERLRKNAVEKGKDRKSAKFSKNDVEKDDELKAKEQAELEMLLLDEEELLRGNKDLQTFQDEDEEETELRKRKKKVSKKERMRMLKAQKRQERAGESEDENERSKTKKPKFEGDLNDPRFQSLFTSSDFALDPTDPRFSKAGPGAEVIASEVVRRRSQKAPKSSRRDGGGYTNGDLNADKPNLTKNHRDGQFGESLGNEEKVRKSEVSDIQMMVASLKRKVGKKKKAPKKIGEF